MAALDITPATRVVVAARSGGRCESCGGQATDMSHRQAKGMGGRADRVAHRPRNLLHLCRPCHARVDADRPLAELLGHFVAPWVADPGSVPTWLRTINGQGWWLLSDDGCFLWVDLPEPML